MYTILTGRFADASQMEDTAEAVIQYTDGQHAGHTASVYTAKQNCGAYQTDVRCSCGARFDNAMNGCWQWGHQRDEDGDPALNPLGGSRW